MDSSPLFISGFDGGTLLSMVGLLAIGVACGVLLLRQIFNVNHTKRQLEVQTKLLKEIARKQGVNEETILSIESKV